MSDGNPPSGDHRASERRAGEARASGPEGLGEVKLRYSREARLARAPESVRWLASRYGAKPGGFLKAMFATRASRLLFFTIVALVVAFNLVPLLERGARDPSEGELGGDAYRVAAFWYQGSVLVSLSRSGLALDEPDRPAITVVASAGEGDSRASAEASFVIGLEAKEDFRLAVASLVKKPETVEIRISRESGALALAARVE